MNRSLLLRIVPLFSFMMLLPSLSYADINDSLRVVIINGESESVKRFLQEGADVNKIYEDQTTPLLEAVNKSSGSSDIVRLLLQHGANPSLKPAGVSAVSAALKTNNEDIIRLLRPYAADEGELYDLALFHRNRNEDNAALDYVDKALTLNPSNHDAWAMKGSIYCSQKNPKDAGTAYHNAFKASLEYLKTDRSADAYATAAWYAVLSADFHEALRIGKEGLSIFPENGLIEINTGHALLFLGSKNEAVTFYKKSSTKLKQHDQFGDQAARQFMDDFSSLKERYPEKLSLIGWAEKRLLEPFDFPSAEIPFGEEKDAVLKLVGEADVTKEGPPIIGTLDPVIKKQFGEGLYDLDLKSQLNATVVEKYSVVYDKGEAVERIDLFFTAVRDRDEQGTLFLVSKFFKEQQGTIDGMFRAMGEPISKELKIQPSLHTTQTMTPRGPVSAKTAVWKANGRTVILDVFSGSSLAVRARMFSVSKKGWEKYLTAVHGATINNSSLVHSPARGVK